MTPDTVYIGKSLFISMLYCVKNDIYLSDDYKKKLKKLIYDNTHPENKKILSVLK